MTLDKNQSIRGSYLCDADNSRMIC